MDKCGNGFKMYYGDIILNNFKELINVFKSYLKLSVDRSLINNG